MVMATLAVAGAARKPCRLSMPTSAWLWLASLGLASGFASSVRHYELLSSVAFHNALRWAEKDDKDGLVIAFLDDGAAVAFGATRALAMRWTVLTLRLTVKAV